MKGHLSSPDGKVQREVEARLWAKERRNTLAFCFGALILLVLAYFTSWKWQVSALAIVLGVAALLQSTKQPNLVMKLPPLLLIGLSGWILWSNFTSKESASLQSFLSQVPLLRRNAKSASPNRTAHSKKATVGYLQGTSRKPVATLFYKGRGKSGKADCSPYSKVIPLPPGHYRVRIEGVRQASIAHERDVLIASGRLTSVGPDR